MIHRLTRRNPNAERPPAAAPPSRKTGDASRLESQADAVAHRQLPGGTSVADLLAFGGGSSSGAHLPEPLLRDVEDDVGISLRSARAHSDAHAAALALRERAPAVTRGAEVFFAPGMFRPDLPVGRALIAHELTHVAQQLGGHTADLSATERHAQAHGAFAPRHSALAAPRGMRLQRCGLFDRCGPQRTSTPAAPTPAQRAQSSRDRVAGLVTEDDAIRGLAPQLQEMARMRASDTRPNGVWQRLAVYRRDLDPSVRRVLDGLLEQTPEGRDLQRWRWTWLLDNASARPAPTPDGGGDAGTLPAAGNAEWSRRMEEFVAGLQSRVSALNHQFPVGARDRTTGREFPNQAYNRLKNTPTQVFELIHEVATPEVPPALLYAIASNEGLQDSYIRPQLGTTERSDRLSAAEMTRVRTDQPVGGFNTLGIDQIRADLDNPGRAALLRPLLAPEVLNGGILEETTHTNEQGQVARSYSFRNLRVALLALRAVIQERQLLFEQDRVALGYPMPTPEERVFFTYVYYNPGPGHRTDAECARAERANPSRPPGGGRNTLWRHQPRQGDAGTGGTAGARVFQDWITSGEYADAHKVLASYRFYVAARIFGP